MRFLRALTLAATLMGLLMATLTVPVAAATTKLELVNGIPGRKVDVCVNGKEVKSGLKYGAFVLRNTKTASAKVRFYARDPRSCRGKLLAKVATGLDDATVVLTRRNPKIVLFDDAGLAGPTLPSRVLGALRHAADLGPVEFSYDVDSVEVTTPIDLSADNSLKGEEFIFFAEAVDEVLTVKVKQAGSNVVPPDFRWLLPALRRMEWILVGTNVDNAKLVFIQRPAVPF